jgi:RNA polymerase sigma factor (sigma-70 family)
MATSTRSESILHLRRSILLRDEVAQTDQQLLEDYISRRDSAAIAALVQRHAPVVWGVCRRVLNDYHDAEDAFQATFLVLFRKASTIASRELLANWLYGVAHQTALKARATAARRKGRERQVIIMPEHETVVQDNWSDLQPLLDQELSRLPEKYRVVIVLCDLEGKTRKEAALQLGCPEGTVGGRLARARTMLAKRLTRHGLAISGGALASVLSQKASSASVPFSVVSSTIKAACLLSAGQATIEVISIKVAVLTEGVLKAMLLTKLKVAIALVFVVLTATLTCEALAEQKPVQTSAGKAYLKALNIPKAEKFFESQRSIGELKIKPIEAATIAAYEKLGAKYGGFETFESAMISFTPGEQAAVNGVPGFCFIGELPEGKLPKLPPVMTPFGLAFDKGFSDEGLKQLKNLNNLHTLDLTLTKITDAGLKELKDLKGLTSLGIGRTEITDTGLAELKNLNKLSSLDLFGTQVTDAGLKELNELKSLTTLNLRFTQVTDAGLKELKGLKNLKSLDLPDTKVTGTGLKELKSFSNLTWLCLMRTNVTDTGMKELKALKNLKALFLNDTEIGDDGLSELKELKNLSSLGLTNTKVTDAGLKHLKVLENLSSLGLGSTAVTDSGLKELKVLKSLTSLYLRTTAVTDIGLKELKDLKNLTALELGESQITDAGLKELKDLKSLSSLHLNCKQLTDEGLKELKDLKNLTTLDLRGTQITDAGLTELRGLKNLTVLNIANTKISDEGLKELKDLKNLTLINLAFTQVSDLGLKELKDLKNLHTLNFRQTHVTDEGVEELQKALPKCIIFH